MSTIVTRRAFPSAILCAVLVLFLTSCASTGEDDEFVEKPAEELYSDARALLQEEDYEAAAVAFEEVERQHPYSSLATEAQIMAAFSYYQGGAYDEAVGAAERFIDLHPGSEEAPYAHYLIGVSYYEQISDVGRDQEMTRESLAAFDELVRRYPASTYAKDARLKIDLANDHLAGKEMAIGRFYQQQQQYVAAINRFRAVIENYQTTTHVPEALMRLTESYLALGLVEEARNSAAVLGYNYPGTPWYERSYALLEEEELEPMAQEGSWLSSIF